VGLPIETEPVSPSSGTLVVVGGFGVHAAVGQLEVRDAVVALAGFASRVTSVCTGTFLLAASGLLEGRRVTTHWRSAAELQARFPTLRVEGDRIYVRDGTIWTSAGVTAGIDLALSLVEEDHSTALAKKIARELVVYYRRPGGQSQFSSLTNAEGASDRVREVVAYMRAHLTDPLDNETLANVACLSQRQFSRVFRSETGETPAKLVERLRAEMARSDVETTDAPVEVIAAATGFADPERMRRAFIRCFGSPPQSLRRWAKRG
jgi:transcriptional regulator GlxA family with amidase domain